MFVLMSKRAAAKVPPTAPPAAQSSARTQNACDPCRIRKSKCDGQVPCGRCRAKQLVCTSSRRHARASGPVTEEHIATLQEQQRRLMRAISRMADVIKTAESRGFIEDSQNTTDSDLSPPQLAEILQRFAPDDQVAIPTSSPVDQAALPSKKRKFQANTGFDQEADVMMDDSQSTMANTKDYQPSFEKFFATVQQHSNMNPDLTTASLQQAPVSFGMQPSETLPVGNTENVPFAAPGGGSAFEFHPQLAPFMDLVDWDASLEHFLNNQGYGDRPDWSLGNAAFDGQDRNP